MIRVAGALTNEQGVIRHQADFLEFFSRSAGESVERQITRIEGYVFRITSSFDDDQLLDNVVTGVQCILSSGSLFH